MNIPTTTNITLDLSPIHELFKLVVRVKKIPDVNPKLVELVTVLTFSILSQLEEKRFVEALHETKEAQVRLTRVLREHVLMDGVHISRELLALMEECGSNLSAQVAEAIRPSIDELDKALAHSADLYQVIELYEKVKSLFLRAKRNPLSFLGM